MSLADMAAPGVKTSSDLSFSPSTWSKSSFTPVVRVMAPMLGGRSPGGGFGFEARIPDGPRYLRAADDTT